MRTPTKAEKEELLQDVMTDLKKDIEDGDLDSLYQMLGKVPTKDLVAYLRMEKNLAWNKKFRKPLAKP